MGHYRSRAACHLGLRVDIYQNYSASETLRDLREACKRYSLPSGIQNLSHLMSSCLPDLRRPSAGFTVNARFSIKMSWIIWVKRNLPCLDSQHFHATCFNWANWREIISKSQTLFTPTGSYWRDFHCVDITWVGASILWSMQEILCTPHNINVHNFNVYMRTMIFLEWICWIHLFPIIKHFAGRETPLDILNFTVTLQQVSVSFFK